MSSLFPLAATTKTERCALRGLRSDLIDPAIAAHHGRMVKRTGDGSIIDFRSVVDAVRCALEVQTGMVERNAGLAPERRIQFRIGIHLGDVVEEADGDLMGDEVNIAARLEGICEPGQVCLSEDAYRQVESRLELQVADLGPQSLKNIGEPVRAYLLRHGAPATQKPPQPAAKTRGVWARGLRLRLRLLSCFLRWEPTPGVRAWLRVSSLLPSTISSPTRHGFPSSSCRSKFFRR